MSAEPVEVNGIIARLNAWERMQYQKAARGLFKAGSYLEEQANRYVPIDEGTLQNSSEVTVDSADLIACVSYDTPYAVRQHEELDYHHKEGREAKWLENRMNDTNVQNNIRALIADELKRP